MRGYVSQRQACCYGWGTHLSTAVLIKIIRDYFTQTGFIFQGIFRGTDFYLRDWMDEIKEQHDEAFAATGHVASIPVIEEVLQTDKRVIEKGTIRVIKKVSEETVVVPLTTRTTQYSIERIAVNRHVDKAPEPVRYEGNTMIISIMEEELVIQKRLKIVEELRITSSEKEVVTDTTVVLKKERVVIERDQNNQINSQQT